MTHRCSWLIIWCALAIRVESYSFSVLIRLINQFAGTRIIPDQRAGAMYRICLSEDWLSKRFATQYDLLSSLSLLANRVSQGSANKRAHYLAQGKPLSSNSAMCA